MCNLLQMFNIFSTFQPRSNNISLMQCHEAGFIKIPKLPPTLLVSENGAKNVLLMFLCIYLLHFYEC